MWWQISIDIIDLVLEALGQHFICLVEDEHLHRGGLESSSQYHVVDSAGSPGNDVTPMLQVKDVVIDISSADTTVNFNLHEVTKGETNTLCLLCQLSGWGQYKDLRFSQGQIDCLKGSEGENACLTSATLALNDHISASNDGQDGPLLYSGWFVESIGIHATKELLRDTKLVETRHNFELL